MGADVAFQVPAGVDPPLVVRTLGKLPKFRALPGEVRVWWLSFAALRCGWGAGESAAQLGPGVGGDGCAGAPRPGPSGAAGPPGPDQGARAALRAAAAFSDKGRK